jgi:hypothetical protein
MARWLGMAVVVTALIPLTVVANGGHVRLYVAEKAVELVPAGSLRTLLDRADLREPLLNGALFGDVQPQGTALFHSAAFRRACLERLLARTAKPWDDDDGRKRLAFLAGLAAHGLSDELWLGLFLRSAQRATPPDPASGGGPDQSPEAAADAQLVGVRGFSPVPVPWLPVDDVVAAAAQLGLAVDATAVAAGHATYVQALADGTSKIGDPTTRKQHAQRYPWLAAHLLDPFTAGAPPFLARVVAAQWQALWIELLAGKPDPKRLVLAVVPSDGHGAHPVAKTDPGSAVAVVLSRPVVAAALGSEPLTVADDLGRKLPVAATVTTAPDDGYLVRAEPIADAPAGRTFLATLRPGLGLQGGVVAPSVTWTFRTGSTQKKPPGEVPPAWHGKSPSFIDTPDEHADGGCRSGRHARRAGQVAMVGLVLCVLVLCRRKPNSLRLLRERRAA